MNSLQKKIMKQSNVSQSLYIQNIASLSNKINSSNEGVKHDSYQRFLMKKKGKVFSNQSMIERVPLYGNKTKSLNLTSKIINCDFCPEDLINDSSFDWYQVGGDIQFSANSSFGSSVSFNHSGSRIAIGGHKHINNKGS